MGCEFWSVGADLSACFVSVSVLAVWVLPAESIHLKGRYVCVGNYALCVYLSVCTFLNQIEHSRISLPGLKSCGTLRVPVVQRPGVLPL